MQNRNDTMGYALESSLPCAGCTRSILTSRSRQHRVLQAADLPTQYANKRLAALSSRGRQR
jgi:hypothetical protein